MPEIAPKATISKKNTPKALTGKQETAAVLVSEDRLTDQQIADSLEICRRTLARWKRNQAFRERVLEIGRELSQRALKLVIGGQERRIAAHEAGFGADAEIRRLEARLDRQALSRASSAAFQRHLPEPEPAPRDLFEDYCYGPRREPQCLSSNLMHEHRTRFG